MDFKTFFRQAPGEPIKASTINMPLDAIEAARNVAYVSPISATEMGGATTISSDEPPEIWASLTSGSGTGPYHFTEKLPQAAGTWISGFQTDASGVDSAYNTINATPTLPVIVKLRRNAAGVWSFSMGSC